MKLIEETGPLKLFYSAPGNTEGLTDVKQTLIQHDGTVLLNRIPMTELGDGVYEYTYNFTSIGWYVSHGISDSLGGADLESIRIGDPANDYVYAGGPNDTTVSFEVNTLNDTNVMSGWMTEIGTTKIFWTDSKKLRQMILNKSKAILRCSLIWVKRPNISLFNIRYMPQNQR